MGPGLRVRWPQRMGRPVQLWSAGVRPRLRAHQPRARDQGGAGGGRQAHRGARRETRAVPGDRGEARALPGARREARARARRPASPVSGQSAGQDPGRPPGPLPGVRAQACAGLRQRTPRTRLWHV